MWSFSAPRLTSTWITVTRYCQIIFISFLSLTNQDLLFPVSPVTIAWRLFWFHYYINCSLIHSRVSVCETERIQTVFERAAWRQAGCSIGRLEALWYANTDTHSSHRHLRSTWTQTLHCINNTGVGDDMDLTATHLSSSSLDRNKVYQRRTVTPYIGRLNAAMTPHSIISYMSENTATRRTVLTASVYCQCILFNAKSYFLLINFQLLEA